MEVSDRGRRNVWSGTLYEGDHSLDIEYAGSGSPTMMKGVIEYRCYYTVSCVVKTSLSLCSVAVACVIRVLWSSVASCGNIIFATWLIEFIYTLL